MGGMDTAITTLTERPDPDTEPQPRDDEFWEGVL